MYWSFFSRKIGPTLAQELWGKRIIPMSSKADQWKHGIWTICRQEPRFEGKILPERLDSNKSMKIARFCRELCLDYVLLVFHFPSIKGLIKTKNRHSIHSENQRPNFTTDVKKRGILKSLNLKFKKKELSFNPVRKAWIGAKQRGLSPNGANRAHPQPVWCNFCCLPEVRLNRSSSAPKRPGWALKRPQSAPKRTAFFTEPIFQSFWKYSGTAQTQPQP